MLKTMWPPAALAIARKFGGELMARPVVVPREGLVEVERQWFWHADQRQNICLSNDR
jgi:hypothetical protein